MAYDPSQFTVAEVQQYLAEHPEEADAVKAAEAAGKGRSTVADWQPGAAADADADADAEPSAGGEAPY